MGDSDYLEGTVVAVRPRKLHVRVADRDVICDLRKGLLRGPREQRSLLAVGDRVTVSLATGDSAVIHECLPRRSKISRLGSLRPRREHVIAANVDQLVAMHATDLPRFNPRSLDRLLMLGEAGSVTCAVCLNKIDLSKLAETERHLAPYRAAGYATFPTCAIRGKGLEALGAFLRGKQTLLLGPSGVGKTTLLNRLMPGLDLATGMISTATGRGVHTTTRVDYLPLPDGGAVLDSPGLRSIQPWIEPHEAAGCFPEMRPLLGDCHFRDCLHRGEPRCAIRKASESGAIDPRRYESYLRIVETLLAEEDTSAGPA